MGSDLTRWKQKGAWAVSTHAPRVGSDGIYFWQTLSLLVSTHAPRVGSDAKAREEGSIEGRFQLTLPEWGATSSDRLAADRDPVSTHAPRVGSDFVLWYAGSQTTVSTHAPRVGSDPLFAVICAFRNAFQLTLPEWGATGQLHQARTRPHRFNSRSPSGERPSLSKYVRRNLCFNSRSPSGERHTLSLPVQTGRQVSTHAPRVGSDDGYIIILIWGQRFNSRSPSGERLERDVFLFSGFSFNSRSPSGERLNIEVVFLACILFQLTLPEWGATRKAEQRLARHRGFNSRSPSGERQTNTL